MEHPTLVILHRQPIVRQALSRTLAGQGQLTLLAEAADPPALKRALALHAAPHLVLMDDQSALANEASLLRWLCAHAASTKVLVVGPHPEAPALLLQALCAGAHGYLPLEEAHERLTVLLHELLHGALHFPEALHAQLRSLHPPTAAEAEWLKKPISPCQREFLRWLLHPDDLTYAQIAKGMGKSERMVEKYRATLFKRFGIKGKTGLVRLAIVRGLRWEENGK